MILRRQLSLAEACHDESSTNLLLSSILLPSIHYTWEGLNL